MKKLTILLAIIIFNFSRAAAQNYQTDASEAFECIENSGPGAPKFTISHLGECKFKEKKDCQAFLDSQPNAGDACAKKIKCVPCRGSGGAASGTWQEQLVQGLVGLIFKKKDPQQAEIEKQNALRRQQEEEQKRLEEEQRRQAGNQAWADLQSQYQRQKEIEAQGKLDAGQELLGKMETASGDDLKIKSIEGDFFGATKPVTEVVTSSGEGGYPTLGFSGMETLRASAYFFAGAMEAAVRSGDYDKAAYLADQADKVVRRRPTSRKVDFAAIPDIPMPSAPERVKASQQELAGLLQSFRRDVNLLLDFEAKIIDNKARIKEVEGKKEKARARLEEAKVSKAAAKPEATADADRLAAEAQKLFDDASEELEKAKQQENDLARQKGQVEDEVQAMNARIQGGGK
jgi:hypothetical protein